jgi:BolA protein
MSSDATAAAAAAPAHGPVGVGITAKLTSTFAPSHLSVANESYMHNVPKGAETHFKVVVVSDAFDGVGVLKRHRAVNECLKEDLDAGVHALSIVAKTPQQWAKSAAVDASPNCMGGAKR